VQPLVDGNEAAETSSLQLQPPAAELKVRRAALQGRRLAALWADGTLQSYNLDTAERQRSGDGGGVAPTVSLPLRGFAFSCPQVGTDAWEKHAGAHCHNTALQQR
jgi:hypothetical protein